MWGSGKSVITTTDALPFLLLDFLYFVCVVTPFLTLQNLFLYLILHVSIWSLYFDEP